MDRRLAKAAMALSLFAAASAAQADTVVFRHGTSLECKVEGLEPEGWRVLVGNDDKASMVLDASTVQAIQYDYDSRLDAVRALEAAAGEPLYLKHYELGIWCEEQAAYDKRMNDRALNRYLHAAGQPDVPHEVYLRIGRMYEACRTPDLARALEAYQAYLAKQPDSAEATEAIARLTPAAATQTPTPVVSTKDEGLEIKPWRAERWANPCQVRAVDDTTSGSAVLQVEYRSGGESKTAFAHPLQGNVSQYDALRMDIYNPGKKPLNVALALVTGANFEWFESKTVRINPESWGMDVQFDMTRSEWKSKNTNWTHRTKPLDLQTLRNLVILVYDQGEGTCFIDNIRFTELGEKR